jgi:CBS domain-containing protein
MEEPYVRQILLLAGYESPQEERRPAGREEPTRGARFAAPPVRFPLSKELQRDVLHGQLGEVLQRAQEADRWEETVDLADSLLDWLAFRSGRGGAMSREPLIPRFAKYLWCFSPDEHLVTALDYMRENDFSQIVVRQEGQLTVLTTEGTAGWLERHAHARPLSLAEARVGDALAHDVPDSAMVMGAAHSVADALAAFTGFLKQGRPRLYAIIITERGTHREEPIGIVTPWDLLGEARGG